MSLKIIFEQGMQERRRRRALVKQGRDLKDKQKALEENLVNLGHKAWESKTDISIFPELQSTLNEAQKALDALAAGGEELRKQQQKLEDKRKRETERLDTTRKGVEGKKRDLDKRIHEQNSQLEADRKETRRANERLTAIERERSQLETTGTDSAAGEEEKIDAVKKMDLFGQEERALRAGIDARLTAGKPIEILVSSLQEESDQMQKQLDDLREEQKEILGELDKKVTAVKNDLSDNKTRTQEMEGRRDSQYRSLGEKLADAWDDYPGLAEEKAAVDKVRGEQDTIQAEITGLEHQKDEGRVGAYKKMMAMIVGCILLLIALIVALVLLFSPGKSAVSPGGRTDRSEVAQSEASTPGIRTTTGTPAEDTASFSESETWKGEVKNMSDIKARSEAIQGGKITIAPESVLGTALPAVDGWQRSEPVYNRSSFQEMESATLETRYTSGNDSVRVHVTDAGTASSLLASMKMALAMNIHVDNESRFSRVTSIKGVAAVEGLDKKDGEATIAMVIKDRYIVELRTEAKGGLDLLREFAARLDISGLH